MSRGDGFLTRWSRRKLGAGLETPRPEVPAVAPEQALAPDTAADEETLPEEELALLPRIEDLTADSDVTGFLRKGVPDVLRKAALRRMWALDPAVRDYIGDARDYAWDWNVPGGVPGNGPLEITAEIRESIERMFSGPKVPDESLPVSGEEGGPVEMASTLPENDSEESGGEETTGVAGPVDLPTAGEDAPAISASSNGLNVAGAVPAGAQPSPSRRHGTALPKLDLF
jgi:hypothetical protein